jgi:eukaryotic-like serine/threonine-protein kinase
MHKKNYSRPFLLLFGCCMIFSLLLAACGTASTPSGPGTGSGQGSNNPGNASTATASTATTQALNTVTTPSNSTTTVTTSCPAAGTARAAVIRSLPAGSQASIVYTINKGASTNPISGTLERYDVGSGKSLVTATFPNTYISDAELSSSGDWILFVAIKNQQAKLQLVRRDGQYLQTLYCVSAASNGANIESAISNVQWSTNEKLIVFNSYTYSSASGGNNQVLLLDTQTGSLQSELSMARGGQLYPVVTWLDNTRVYLRGPSIDMPADSLYLLDTSKAPNQPLSNLSRVFQDQATSNTYPCWDFDSSYDGHHLYTTQCTLTMNSSGPGENTRVGPSKLSVQPATGGTASTFYNNANVAITVVRAISSNTLLLLFENQSYSSTSVDTSQNGLWKINTNGSGLTRLTTDGGGVAAGPSELCQYSQYPWSNVSLDGKMYALQHNSSNGAISLMFGALSGGNTTTFASASGGSQLSIVGWTTA